MRQKTISIHRTLRWALAIMLFITYSIISVKKSWNDDFRAYYQAGSVILSYANIYDQSIVEGGFLYSPLFALLMVPLSFLPQLIAATFWYLVNLSSLILSIAIAIYLSEGSNVSLSTWLKTNLILSHIDRERKLIIVFVLILSSRFWLNNIEHGQVNLIMWCIVLISIVFLRSDRVVIGSALLGFSVTIKILPLIFVFYFLFRKKFNIVLLSFCFLLLFILIPAAVLGWQHNLNLLEAWFHKIIEPNFTQGAIGVGDSNQSFPAMLTRFLSQTPANEETGASVNFLSFSDETISLIIRLSSLMFLTVIATITFSGKKKTIERENLELSIVFLSAVMMPMLAWKAYFVASIMGYTVVVSFILKMNDTPFRRILITLMIISFIFHTFTSDGLWGWKFAHIFQSYSCVTFSMILLYASLILILLKTPDKVIITN